MELVERISAGRGCPKFLYLSLLTIALAFCSSSIEKRSTD